MLPAANPIAFEQLGWRSFQDLTLTVCEEVFGVPVQQFAPTKDLGQDGLVELPFQGRPGGRRIIIQSKHTSELGMKLTLSSFKDDIEKVAKLTTSDAVHRYFLVTNCSMTAGSRDAIVARLKSSGVASVVIIERSGLERQVRTNSRLRAKVPRLYGIGDLSSILDERRIEQSRAILESMAHDLNTFVPTLSYRQAVDALNAHHMVVLLGDPASGKTTIAKCLIVGSIDQYAGEPIVIKSFKEIRDHWKPGGGPRIFYFDDFLGWGSIIWDRVYELNDNVDFIRSAISSGCRFIFTCRNYVWQEAMSNIKLSQMVSLKNGKVAIDLHELTNLERAQILFNHLKVGNQTKEWLNSFGSVYKHVVLNDNFTPECARRFGQVDYTGQLRATPWSVKQFVDNQGEYLIESIKGLTKQHRGALAAVYMSADAPLGARKETPSVRAAMDLYGLDIDAIRTAIGSMKDVFVKEEADVSSKGWVFKHPTIREALAQIVRNDGDLIEIAIRGSRISSLLTEGVCEGVDIKGGRLIIPASLEVVLVARIRSEEPWIGRVIDFLTGRASPSFRHAYFDGLAALAHPAVAASLRPDERSCKFMGLLDREQILDPAAKAAFMKVLGDRASSLACSDFPLDAKLIMSADEYQAAIETALETWESRYEEILGHHAGNWSEDVRPESYFEGLLDKLADLVTETGSELNEEFRDKVWDEATPYIEDLEARYEVESDDDEQDDLVSPTSAGQDFQAEAEIDALFADVAA